MQKTHEGKSRLIVIGNPVADLVSGEAGQPGATYKLGGAVGYTGVGAAIMGEGLVDAVVISKAPLDRDDIYGVNYIKTVNRPGVSVIRIDPTDNRLTIFHNTYSVDGVRTQKCIPNPQPITLKDIVDSGLVLTRDDIVIHASTFQDSDPSLIEGLSKLVDTQIAIIQGYARAVNHEGTVHPTTPTELLKVARHLHAISLSEEDIAGVTDANGNNILNELITHGAEYTLLTKGPDGAEIFRRGTEFPTVFRQPAYELVHEEKERLLTPGPHVDAAFTGLGDTWIAHYGLRMAGWGYSLLETWEERHNAVAEAVQSAGLACTLKIRKALSGGKGGIEGAPSLDEWLGSTKEKNINQDLSSLRNQLE